MAHSCGVCVISDGVDALEQSKNSQNLPSQVTILPLRGEALVRVVAAGITPTELSWSSAYQTRDKVDRLPAIPDHEFARIVESVGPDAANVKVGEAVYALADRDGSDAEYIAIAASDLAPKPRTLDFTQAAPHCQGATANIIPPSDRELWAKVGDGMKG